LISTDPDNDDLLKLKADLEELISLCAEQKTAPVTKTVVEYKFKQGQTVLAKWSKDGRFYEAVVTKVPDTTTPTYTVLYSKYGSSEQLKPEDVKEFNAEEAAQSMQQKKPQKKRPSQSQSSDTAEKKQKKPHDELHREKQQSWLNFKKDLKIGGSKERTRTFTEIQQRTKFK
jgi:hypothetical protein